MIRDEKGIAMVLAITLVGLLACLGLYLILESDSTFRTTKAMDRYERAFNLADGGVQLGLKCVRSSAPAPTYGQILGTGAIPSPFPTAALPSYMQVPPAFGSGASITPYLDFIGYRTVPPPGWMVNRQGYSQYHGVFYRPRSQGQITLPSLNNAGDNNAVSITSSVALKVQR